MRRIPCATYRLQLQPGFGFAEAAGILDYLDDLGVTDLYLSPVLEGQPGSTHGYDVTDHAVVRTEIGGGAGLRALAEAARERDMGVILDVVPNHMSIAGDRNAAWLDVLENGPSSSYARWFDVDWQPPKPDLVGKVLLPVLGDQFGRVLEAQGLRIELDAGAFFVRVHGAARLPLGPRTWPAVLAPALARVRPMLGEAHPHVLELESVIAALERLPLRTETARAQVIERRREREICRRRLAALCDACPELARAIAREIELLDGTAGDPASFDRLEELLAEQGYRLAHWRVAADEINYRRFFDINDLAALRVEEPAVMAAVHDVPLRLVREGLVSGLRIDHIDGLLEPAAYLEALQRAAGAALREGGAADVDPARPLWIVVEKILAVDETLAESWPVDGTTGYELLNRLTALHTDPAGAQALARSWRDFVGGEQRFADEVYQAKKLILRVSMSAEATVLARRLDRISEQHRYTRDFTLKSLQEALEEFIACFPVYRTYAARDDAALAESDRRHVLAAMRQARRRNPAVSASIFELIAGLCLLEDPPGLDPSERRERRELVLRLQQLTGPVTAKALEDTAFYRYTPLCAHSEVGGHPEAPSLSVEAWHDFAARRRARWPHALSATSTHDTKRAEDVRARLVGLAEMPERWEETLARWRAKNAGLKTPVHGEPAPDPRDEHLCYQTLLGVWPAATPGAAGLASLRERLLAYLTKAMREAKVHTSWVDPDQAYERAALEFATRLLDPATGFVPELEALAGPLARVGLCVSLAQTLLKVAAPGVPDVYQGCEAVSLTLVDPDNRRPVDHRRLADELAALEARAREDGPAAVASRLLAGWDERIKLWVTRQALRARRHRQDVYTLGDYTGLGAHGARRAHVVAFARRHAGMAVIAVAGRFFVALGAGERPPVGEVWGETWVELPDDLGEQPLRDALTGVALTAERRGGRFALPLSRAFAALPVALLELDR